MVSLGSIQWALAWSMSSRSIPSRSSPGKSNQSTLLRLVVLYSPHVKPVLSCTCITFSFGRTARMSNMMMWALIFFFKNFMTKTKIYGKMLKCRRLFHIFGGVASWKSLKRTKCVSRDFCKETVLYRYIYGLKGMCSLSWIPWCFQWVSSGFEGENAKREGFDGNCH